MSSRSVWAGGPGAPEKGFDNHYGFRVGSHEEVEAAWKIVEPIIKSWELEKSPTFPNYTAGSSGPIAADEWLARDGRQPGGDSLRIQGSQP